MVDSDLSEARYYIWDFGPLRFKGIKKENAIDDRKYWWKTIVKQLWKEIDKIEFFNQLTKFD